MWQAAADAVFLERQRGFDGTDGRRLPTVCPAPMQFAPSRCGFVARRSKVA
jgi:hypothetical protein